MEFRGYQAEDDRKIQDAQAEGHRRILFESSVAAGKSLHIVVAAKRADSAGIPVLTLSNRTAVVDQLNDKTSGLALAQAMTVHAAARRLGKLDAPGLIIVDEAHMGGMGRQYGSVFAKVRGVGFGRRSPC